MPGASHLGQIRRGSADGQYYAAKGICDHHNFQESTDILALLKACAKQKDLHKGTTVHADIIRRGLLEKNCYVASTLVNMYVTCGALAKAAQVLDELPVRDLVSWNALIAGYSQQGQGEEALRCFDRMQNEGLSPNTVTFSCILKACGSIGAADKGEQIHDQIVSQGLLRNNCYVASTLVNMYAKCGALAKAARVLDELPIRDVVSWNALIAGYAQHGQGEEALKCFEQMQREGLSPNTVTFTCILKACGSIGAADRGDQIHEQIVKRGLLKNNCYIASTLVNMYAKCGALAKAAQVLEELPVRDVVSWNALIAGYIQKGQGNEALRCFEQLQNEGLSPDTVTFTCSLKACGLIGAADKGERIHDQIVRRGLLGKDIVLGTSLVDMYAKCGALVKAAQVLDEIPVRDVVTWSALITGYVQQGLGEEALKCFEWMQREGLTPNVVTFICILKACGRVGAIDKGEQIHHEIGQRGLLGKDIVLGNTLVDMYARCGAFAKAAQVLNELPVRDAVSWSSLITGFAEQGQGEEALKCFDRMQCEGHSPDKVTFICALKACGMIGAADKGEKIHDEILRQGLLECSIVLGNALVDMYAKCGALAKAAQVLDTLSVRDLVTWNALLAGYAQQGEGEEALKCFERIESDSLSPDAITLACVVSACSRSGLLQEGQTYFSNMRMKHGIAPDIELLTCMVDLFGRAGEFDKALAVIRKTPSDDLPLWLALLGACQECGNVKLARLAFDNAVRLEKNDAAAYTLMTKVYAAAGMQEEAKNIAAMREKRTMGETRL